MSSDYKKIDLKSGLRLVVVPSQSTEVVTLMAMFGVGSRYETDEVAGISHLLEHMFFKGTEKRPSGMDLALSIESIGGQFNAFTGKEYTAYYAKLVPEHLEEAFDIISDMLLNSKFESKELDREKNVVVEEINMYEDLPSDVASSKFELAMFGENRLGKEIIGKKESVCSIDRETMVSYKDSHYNSLNCVLVVAGKVADYTEEDLKALAEKYFAFESKIRLERGAIELKREKALSVVNRPIEQSHIVAGYRTVPIDHPDYYTLSILALILGGSMSSRMFEEVREKRGLAYAVKSSVVNYVESGALFTQAGVPHEKVFQAFEAIMNEYEKIKTEPVTEEELKKAKEIIKGKLLIKFEDSEEVACHYASDMVLMGRIVTPKEALEIYKKIESSDILEAAKRYFVPENLALSFVGRDIDEEEIRNSNYF